MDASRLLPPRHLVAYCWIALTLGPILAHVVPGIERWPWSPCPMFSRYHQASDTRWNFIITTRTGDGEFQPLELRAAGLLTVPFWRHFFVHVYGSTNPSLPQGGYPNDTPEAFSQRLGRWFTGVVTQARQRQVPGSTQWTELHLGLVELLPDGTRLPPRTIGRYDPATGTYVRMVP